MTATLVRIAILLIQEHWQYNIVVNLVIRALSSVKLLSCCQREDTHRDLDIPCILCLLKRLMLFMRCVCLKCSINSTRLRRPSKCPPTTVNTWDFLHRQAAKFMQEAFCSEHNSSWPKNTCVPSSLSTVSQCEDSIDVQHRLDNAIPRVA